MTKAIKSSEKSFIFAYSNKLRTTYVSLSNVSQHMPCGHIEVKSKNFLVYKLGE